MAIKRPKLSIPVSCEVDQTKIKSLFIDQYWHLFHVFYRREVIRNGTTHLFQRKIGSLEYHSKK